MRLLILLSILLGASLSLACPDLSGKYSCTDNSTGSTFPSTIKQSIDENGITIYESSRKKTIADGLQKVSKAPVGVSNTSIASCNGTTELEVAFVYQMPSRQYKHKVTSRTTKTVNNNINLNVSIEEFENGTVSRDDKFITCIRKAEEKKEKEEEEKKS